MKVYWMISSKTGLGELLAVSYYAGSGLYLVKTGIPVSWKPKEVRPATEKEVEDHG